MDERGSVALRDLTTLRVGGTCRRVLEPRDEIEVVEAVTTCDAHAEAVLVVGGGSNLVVADEGFAGTVVLIASRGISVLLDGEDHVSVEVAAGEPWDAFVERAVSEGWSGVESLAGIPGRAGATPVQNVGAYGHEVAETVTEVRVLDRARGAVSSLTASECGFDYRTSRFKGADRLVVLSVTLRLGRSPLSAPLAYAELAGLVGAVPGARVPAAEVRAAVLELRRGKGMVLDPDDPDTASVGSFFTNPLLSAEEAAALPAGAPVFVQPDGRTKTSAAWLIEQAGFARGYGHGDARISSKHTLALTNRGAATTSEVLALAREIRDGVRRTVGVELVVEPRLVGVQL